MMLSIDPEAFTFSIISLRSLVGFIPPNLSPVIVSTVFAKYPEPVLTLVTVYSPFSKIISNVALVPEATGYTVDVVIVAVKPVNVFVFSF